MDNGKIEKQNFVILMHFIFVEHVTEVDQDHHVNVRNTVIVHVVHVIATNIDVVKIMMANIVVNIDVVSKMCNSCFSDIYAIW
jgi:hypothetical protein